MIAPPVGGRTGVTKAAYAGACWYLVGAIVGGSSIGAVCAAAGFLLRHTLPQPFRWGYIVLGTCAIVYAIADIAGRQLKVPSSPWRVPRRWGQYGAIVPAIGFGFSIGTGVLTVVPWIGYYLLLVLCCLNHSAALPIVVLATSGLMRGSLGFWSTNFCLHHETLRPNCEIVAAHLLASLSRALRPWRTALLVSVGVFCVVAAAL